MSSPVPPAHPDEPLGLTVHSLPSLNPQEAQELQRTRQGRLRMLLVLVVCAAPVVASYFTYYVIRPEGRRNHGDLISPQRPLPLVAALDLQGKVVDLQSLKGQWLIMTVASAACDSACQSNLYWARQLRESLGREKDRVDRVWLVSDAAPINPRIEPGLEGATVLRVPASELAAWLAPAPGHRLSDHVYLVDPLGNWMMRFAAPMDLRGAAQAKTDLERLLRASAAWDEPGRKPS